MAANAAKGRKAVKDGECHMTFSYQNTIVTISEYVDYDLYATGDYALLCWDNGSGTVDFINPANKRQIDLQPTNGGLGWGEVPWGDGGWGDVGLLVSTTYAVNVPGAYKFGFKTFDKLKNPHTGTPGEATIYVCATPQTAKRPVLVSYDFGNKLLTLTRAAA